jgi:hypothetical protein
LIVTGPLGTDGTELSHREKLFPFAFAGFEGRFLADLLMPGD